MTSAIWMINYDLNSERTDEYIAWFDGVHIPEKLARSGYTWAAHYQVVADSGKPSSSYIALFGGTSTRVFYDPSPAQIKPTQSPETRDMMSCRANTKMMILTQEWVAASNNGKNDIGSEINSEIINLALCDSNGNDEDFGAWLVQDAQVDVGNLATTRKLLASTGAVKHAVICEYPPGQPNLHGLVDPSASAWSSRVSSYLTYPVGVPVTARRVWPKID
jgi:hypothetical protein